MYHPLPHPYTAQQHNDAKAQKEYSRSGLAGQPWAKALAIIQSEPYTETDYEAANKDYANSALCIPSHSCMLRPQTDTTTAAEESIFRGRRAKATVVAPGVFPARSVLAKVAPYAAYLTGPGTPWQCGQGNHDGR